ncbi:integrase [Roseobacter phage CRP-345]|nr:integrase [Roseobacter phage CRP-345]
MRTLPRYVQQRVSPSGDISYRFNPPQTLVDAGVVERDELGSDPKEARKLAKELNKQIDEYREEQSKIVGLKPSSRVTDLINFYYLSNDFKMLRDSTKVDYRYFLTVVHQTIGCRKYKDVTPKIAKQAYEQWVERGISFANHAATCASRVYNYAIQMEHAEQNPFAKIKRKTTKQRKMVWSHGEVNKFLDVAYSDFDYRNVGLIVHMAYEWCQRLGDMRMLKWENLDLDKQQLTLEQSKRRADVFLPISDNLTAMLKEQKADFGFQEWVVPHPMPVKGKYKPYAMERLSKVGRRIMRLAKLPEELRLMDIRRTGVTQMVDKGVPLPQIMAVTGHTHVSSVKPYMKHTYESANSALTQRDVCVQSTVRSNIESDTL